MNVVLNCRTCTRACKNYKSLYEVNLIDGESTTLAELLTYCTGIKFNPNDLEVMPYHMCKSCITLLEQSYQFKRMVLESDELLRQGLQMNNDYIMIEMEALNADAEANVYANSDTEIDTNYQNKYKRDELETFESLSVVDMEFVDQIDVATTVDVDTNEEQIQSDNVNIPQQVCVEYVDVKTEMDDYIAECDENEPYDDIGEEIYIDEYEEGSILHDSNDGQLTIIDEVENINDNDDYVVNNGDTETNAELRDDDQGGETDEGNTANDNEGDDKIEGFPQICDICGKAFRQFCRLKQHMLTHTNEKVYNCEFCGKKLKHMKNYKDHLSIHTDLKPHQCNICDRFYRTTSSLAAHKRTHAKIKPYRCDECGRGFSVFDHMRRHKLTHTGERPHACNLCDKAYYDSSSLRTHMLSHSGIKAFTCEICGIGLTQKSGYKKHMLVHSGVKPHKCPICQRAFTFTSNLNAHVRLHSGEKPFKCEKCPKCFPTKKRLQSHQRVHNKETVVAPVDNTNSFERRAALRSNGQRPINLNNMPDMPDHQVSRSKVVVVL